MATDLIPVVDLRFLSQADLAALAASSAPSASFSDLDSTTLKIDRSVFNESAGSRKQTYSRLRLAPRDPSLPRRRGRPRSNPAPAAPDPAAADDPGRRENRLIAHFLRQLFARHDATNTQNATNLPEEKDKEVLNGKGVSVNLVELGEKVDPYGEELRRRTEGLASAEQLLGYLSGLDGQWGSRRRRKKIVDAARFGDHLPRGWKLLIGIRRKEGIARLDCRKYISPSGKKFVSCKDVSSYILSLVGPHEARQPISGLSNENTPKHDKLTLSSNAGLIYQSGIAKESTSCSSLTSFSSISAVHEKQKGLFKFENEANIEQKNILECHKCNVTFDNKDAHMQHLLSSHKRNTKRRRLGKTIGDGVIVKDGKYECQYCHKTFSERRPYYGHIGAHVRYQGLGAEALPEATMRKSADPTSSAVAPHIFSEMNALDKKNEENYSMETFFAKSVHEEQFDSSHVNPKCDVPVIQVIVSKSDDNTRYCNAASDRSEEIVRTGNVTNLRSNTSNDVVSASYIDVTDTMQSCSPKVTEDASTSKSADGQINNLEKGYCKSEEVIEVVNVKHSDHNSCLNGKSFPVDMDNTDCDILNQNSLSFSMFKSDDVDINLCNKTDKPEELPKPSSVVDAEPNECMDASGPSLTKVNNATCETSNEVDISSCSMNSEIEMYSGGQKIGSESNLISLSANGANCSAETFVTNVYTNSMEENVFVKIDTSMNEMEFDFGSGRSRSAINDGTMHNECHTGKEQEIDLQSCVLTPFGSGFDQDIEISADCTFHSNVKEPFLEDANQPSREMENCFDINVTGNCEDAVNDAIKNDLGGEAMQVDVAGISSSWVQASPGPSILDMIPDQCEGDSMILGQKNGNMSGFEVGGIDPSNLVLLTSQELTSVSGPHLELGLGRMENGHQPSGPINWDLSSAKLEPEFISICAWCSREFSHEDANAELQSDSLGFICPLCKAKISGQLNAVEDGFPK